MEGNRLIIHSRIAQRLLMQIDLGTLDTASTIIPDPGLEAIRFQNPRVLMSDHNIFIADARARTLLTLPDTADATFSKNEIPTYSLIMPTSDTTFVLRTYSALAEQDILTWIDVKSGERKDNDSALQKQIDGIFCVDGNILFNRSLQRIVYVYYYRNEFIVSDARLKTVRRGRTIDQTDSALIQVDTFENSGQVTTTFKSPPHFVNVKNATDGDYLYVLSNVKAINQERAAFESTYTIDQYSLITMTYNGSFILLPPKDRHELKNFDFAVSGDKLIAIFDDNLVVYRIDFNSQIPQSEQDPK